MEPVFERAWWTEPVLDITDWRCSDIEAYDDLKARLINKARKHYGREPRVLRERGTVWREGPARLGFVALLLEAEVEDS